MYASGLHERTIGEVDQNEMYMSKIVNSEKIKGISGNALGGWPCLR